MNSSQLRLNSKQLAQALGCGVWVIYGVKKANRIFAAQGREPMIFTGWLSTPAKVSRWLDAHPDFVASRTLTPHRAKAKPVPEPLPQHPRAAA
jgi:hypothetical protein